MKLRLLPGCARIAPHVVGACVAIVSITTPDSAHAQSNLPPEIGYRYGELETPRSTAVGGALRATGTSISSPFVNPANMAIAHVYHVGAFAQIDPEAARQTYGGAIVDSLVSSTGIAGGLTAAWSQQDPDGVARELLDLRFGLAIPLADVLYVGAMARYLNLSQQGRGPLGQSLVSGGLEGAPIVQTVTFDLGATLRPIPEFMIAITGHNLTNQDHSFLPLMGGLAIGFANEDFSLGADAVLEEKTFNETNVRVQGGGELLLADHVNLRAGYRYEQVLDTHAVSAGVGYIEPRFSVDAAVRRSVAGTEYTSITFGFAVHIEAMNLGMSE